MRLSRHIVFILLATIGGAACSDSTKPADLLLTTDSTSYTAVSVGGGAVAVAVVTTYRNPTSAPIGLDRCPNHPHPEFDVQLVSPQNNEGAAYAMGVCLAPSPPIVVAAGETRVDTLVLTAPTSYDTRTGRFLGAMEGTFRIGYGGQRSNEFRIALPPGGVVPGVGRDLSAAIQTDSQLVHMTFKAPLYTVTPPIHVTIYNTRPDTSFIINCGGTTGLSLEKQTGNDWVLAWGAVVPLCLSPAIVIPPGGSYQTSVDVYGVPVGTNAAPIFFVKDLPGVYRLVWTNIIASRNGQPIPVELRRSNAFAIVVTP